MEDKILHRIECELLNSNIRCVKTQSNSTFEHLNLYSSLASNTQIYLHFSQCKGDILVADSFVYEELFLEIQDLIYFSETVKGKLNKYLDILKFIFSSPNTKLGNISVTHPHPIPGATLIGGSIGGGLMVSGTIDSIEKQTKKYLRNYPNYSLNNTLEYVERYNAIQQIKDPVLKLISFEALVEYIEDHLGIGKRKRSNNNGLFNSQNYRLSLAIRDLVSHGVVSGPTTRQLLQKELKCSETKFAFKRKDHLELVKKAVQVYSQELHAYLSNLLL